MRACVFLIALCCVLGTIANADTYLIKVEPKTEDCFYEDFEAGAVVHFEYHVVDGGLFDIEIKLFQQTVNFYQHLYYEGRDEPSYSFVAAQTGPYAFCFNNEMSRWTVKTITFSVRTDKKQATAAEPTAVEAALKNIQADFEAIEREQSYYRVREHMHRNAADITNSRVYMWSLFESTVLVLMCLGQVFYLKRLFEDKRR